MTTVTFNNAQEAKDHAHAIAKFSKGNIKASHILNSLAGEMGLSTSRQYLDHLDSQYNQLVRIWHNSEEQLLKFAIGPDGALDSELKEYTLPLRLSSDDDTLIAKDIKAALPEMEKYERWEGWAFYDELKQLVINIYQLFGEDAWQEACEEYADELFEDFDGVTSNDGIWAEICRTAYKSRTVGLMRTMRYFYDEGEGRLEQNADADEMASIVYRDALSSMVQYMVDSVFLRAPESIHKSNHTEVMEYVTKRVNSKEFKLTFLLFSLVDYKEQSAFIENADCKL